MQFLLNRLTLKKKIIFGAGHVQKAGFFFIISIYIEGYQETPHIHTYTIFTFFLNCDMYNTELLTLN